MSSSRLDIRPLSLALALGIAACGGDTITSLPATPPGDNGGGGGSGGNGPAPATGLRTAATHPMQYYVSLPSNWSRARTWPVVVSIAGSGKEWTANHAAFSGERDARSYPFIIVTPVVLTNGGLTSRTSPAYMYSSAVWDQIERDGRCPFDLNGIRAVVAEVATLFNGDKKFFMTGFSGGGQTLAAMLLLHPEVMRASGHAAANYGGRCVTGFVENSLDDPVVHPVSTAPERVTLPVRFFNGTSDGYNQFLLPQRDSLTAIARRNGYTNITSTMVPNTGHEAMPSQVLAFFYSLLAANER